MYELQQIDVWFHFTISKPDKSSKIRKWWYNIKSNANLLFISKVIFLHPLHIWKTNEFSLRSFLYAISFIVFRYIYIVTVLLARSKIYVFRMLYGVIKYLTENVKSEQKLFDNDQSTHENNIHVPKHQITILLPTFFLCSYQGRIFEFFISIFFGKKSDAKRTFFSHTEYNSSSF